MIRWYLRRRRRVRLQHELQSIQNTMVDLGHAHDIGRLTRYQYWTANAVLEIRASRTRTELAALDHPPVGATAYEEAEFARTGRNWGGRG